MLSGNIQKMIGEAMKAHDEIRLSTLRLLSSAFNYEKIAKQHELSDEEELVVIRKEAKQRKDSIEAYKKAGSEDRVKREESELKILQEFLPLETSLEEIEKTVNEILVPNMQIGQIIGLVKSKLPNADGSKIALIVKEKLNG